MQIIPVLDLWQNKVVHARAGQRAEYKPIQSKLCDSSEAVEVLKALAENYPISHCYLADLNALQQQTPQIEIINNLVRHFPHISFYLDSGLRTLADYETWAAAYATQRIYPVLGSETLTSFAEYQQIHAKAENSILSLDFFQDKFLGDVALLEHSETWTNTVIHLNLHRVGTQSGIELAQLQQLQQRAPQCAWIAAGGVRALDDLHRLQQQGALGVLCATALHDLSLTPQNMACFFNS
jgi:phosphoribosylformimino-5-aminoimidazole carboxamide ribotide isomerase